MTTNNDVLDVCKKTLEIVQTQPTREDMQMIAENASLKAVGAHAASCPVAAELPRLIANGAKAKAELGMVKGVRQSVFPSSNDTSVTKWLKVLIPLVSLILGALGYGVVSPGCGTVPLDTCTQGATQRCNGSEAQICDGDHWTTFVDCDLIRSSSGGPLPHECRMEGVDARCREVTP